MFAALGVGVIPSWGCSVNEGTTESEVSAPETNADGATAPSLESLDLARLHRVPIDCDDLSHMLAAWLTDADRVRTSTSRDGDVSEVPGDYDRVDGMALLVALNTVADFDNSTGSACGTRVEFWQVAAAGVSGPIPGVGDRFRAKDPQSTAMRFWADNYPDAIIAVRSFRE